MNSTQTSDTVFDPQLDLGPRQVDLHQLLSFASWVPALAVTVFLSLHRVITSKPDSAAIRVVAFVSLLVILTRIGHQSDIWQTRP